MFSGKFDLKLPSADEVRNMAENSMGSVRNLAENSMGSMRNMAESSMSNVNANLSNMNVNMPSMNMNMNMPSLERVRNMATGVGIGGSSSSSSSNAYKSAPVAEKSANTNQEHDENTSVHSTDQLLPDEEGLGNTNPVNGGVGELIGSATQSASGWFSSVTGITLSAEEEQADEWDLTYFCGQMSLKTRVQGFIICYSLGSLLLFMSSLSVGLVFIRPSKFAMPYTVGSVLSLASSLFFVGPKRFVRTMFDPTRRRSSIVYIFSLIGTLVTVLFLHSGILTLLLLMVQISSYLWLIASYIPYGRTMLLKLMEKLLSFIIGS
mmetsp:Transcript_18242/g.20624  ORF Transcript_18242/g.20624 Transcript_18242/m.20624 type:complete len:321 (+) Transcript_18242:121-1083(+)